MHEPRPARLVRLAEATLYLCTDARRERGDLAEFADAVLAGGVDIIQLRDKGSAGEQRFGPLEARDELAACEILADAARRHGALFAVNDRADIARAAGADVLHLGQGDLPVRVARDIVGPDTLIGLSDGGAHLGILCDAGYATYVLGHWVREAKVLSLEQAVYRLTAQPAEVFGITDRGWLREGMAADIVVFDPATVGSMSRPEKRHDLPGGGKRFVMKSQGVSHTIVNGTVVYKYGEMTGVRSGRLIRAS